MCISVDLPEPDGPITAVSRPRSTSSDTPRSAATAAPSLVDGVSVTRFRLPIPGGPKGYDNCAVDGDEQEPLPASGAPVEDDESDEQRSAAHRRELDRAERKRQRRRHGEREQRDRTGHEQRDLRARRDRDLARE